mgnify:CR=1 FL=1
MKLKIATALSHHPKLLILDEPTNHIDIDTREMLEEALQEYNGTVLFVSHDRYFIDKLSQETFEIEEEKIDRYAGNYSDLKQQKERANQVFSMMVIFTAIFGAIIALLTCAASIIIPFYLNQPIK